MTNNNENQPNSVSTEPGKTIIAFTNNATPKISNYNGLYAHYGQYPDVKCIIKVDANSGYQLQQMPQFTYINGRIDTIYFLPGEAANGDLVLS